MNELKKLLESDLLNDENKAAIKEEIDKRIEEAKEEAKKNLEVEYAQKLTEDKALFNTRLVEMVNETVESEIKELVEDIDYFRNLEVEYAQKLDEFKKEYAKSLNESFGSAVEERITDELEELNNDLMEAKKAYFGKRIFEAFAEEMKEFGITEDVKELQNKLNESKKKADEATKAYETLRRTTSMNSLLENLSGSKKEVMRTILENVSTDRLEDRYNEVIDSVLNEEKNKEGKKLSESNLGGGISVDSNADDDGDWDRIRALSGIK